MSSKSLKERFREIGAIELLQDTTWRLAEECDSGELIDRFAKRLGRGVGQCLASGHTVFSGVRDEEDR